MSFLIGAPIVLAMAAGPFALLCLLGLIAGGEK